MRNFIIGKQLRIIQKYNHFDKEKLEIIKYGLESIYILITKMIVILTVSYLLGLIKETLIFLICYNFIRMPSFGLHATKSWICLVSSLLVFIILPFGCKVIQISFYLKIIMGLIGLAFIIKNAPADTYKRPIISKKRRLFLKIISSITALCMIIASLFIKNQFLANSLLVAIILQCFMISPTIYHLFKLPYNNYKNYQ
ncbi:MAG: accessory gene regulator AgrB [Bacilli bacterium]|nr:accessory gene regulator AgrB [Bacilli bacterium]